MSVQCTIVLDDYNLKTRKYFNQVVENNHKWRMMGMCTKNVVLQFFSSFF